MQKNTPRLEHLVSLRGIAAWWVVFFHSLALMMSAYPTIPKKLVTTISYGYLAVDFFFVLSGFIIFINYHDKFSLSFRRNILPFYWNRLTRIYPVHLIMLLAYLMLAGVFLYASTSHALPLQFAQRQFFENLFLVQAWQIESTSWNVPAWSVSAEWFVYLLFPFIAASLARFAHGLLAKVLLAVAVFIVVIAFGTLLSEGEAKHVLMLPLVRATHEFLLGAIVGALFIHHKNWLINAKPFFMLLIVGVAIMYYLVGVPHYFFVPFCCFCSLCIFSVDESWLTRLLNMKYLVYLGEISYSTYMIHYFVKDIFKASFVSDLRSVNPYGLVASFLFVLLASMVMYRYFEMPAQGFLRKRFFVNRKKSVAA